MQFSMINVHQLVANVDKTNPPLTGNPFLDGMHLWARDLVAHYTPYYLLFYKLAQELKPDLVVELGAWRGFGAAHFAIGNPDTQVITVDIHKDEPQKEDHAHTVSIAARVPNLDFLHAWTWDAAPVIAERGKPIDILYIDAWHKYKLVKREWKLYTPLLADHALIIMDDIFDATGATENMIKFWSEIKQPKFLNYTMHEGIPFGFVEWGKGT